MKIYHVLFIVILILSATSAAIAGMTSSYAKNGELISIESHDDSSAFKKTTSVLETAGWKYVVNNSAVPAGTKTDVECKIDASELMVIIRCRAAGHGYGTTVRDENVRYNNDYAGIPAKVNEMFKDVRQTMLKLGLK